MPSKPQAELMIRDLEALKVYFDPIRLRLLQAMANQPRSVHELAAITGIPFTRLYYHMHQLEKHNFIQTVETRAGAGAIEEKYYQITAYSFVIDRDLLKLGTPEGEAWLAAVDQNFFEAMRQDLRQSLEAGVIDLQTLPPHPRALMLRGTVLRLQADDATEFYERLMALSAEFVQRQTASEEAQSYHFATILYPTQLNKEDDP